MREAVLLKKWLGKCKIVSDNGSVSVYLIVIIVPIFLFQAVLIDYTRIRIFEREAESAVKTGVRSVLSDFDTALQSYGLFGLSAEDPTVKSLFSDVIQANITPAYPGKHLQLLDEQLDHNTISLKYIYSLANQTVFHQQVLEEMKYKAPVEYSLELVNKFKNTGLTSQLNQAAQFSDHAEELEKLIQQRNKALDEAWIDTTHFLNNAEKINGDYRSQIQKIQELADQIGLNSLENIKDSISSINNNIEQMNDTLNGLKESLQSTEAEITNIQNNLQQLANKKTELEQVLTRVVEYTALVQIVKNNITYDFTKLSNDYKCIIADLKQAEDTNDQLETLKQKLIQQTDPKTNLNSTLVYQQLLIYDINYFSAYKTGPGKILAAFSGLKTRLDNANAIAFNFYEQWMKDSNGMQAEINDFRQTQGTKESQRQNASDQIKLKKTDELNKIDQVVNGAKSIIQGCNSLDHDPYSDSYLKLNGDAAASQIGLYEKYQLYNTNSSEVIANEQIYTLTSAEKLSNQAVNWMKQFSILVADFRDKMYLDEYAISNFQYRTSLINDAKHMNRTLYNQEVEYILYGQGACTANYAAAYGEMFVFFLAIRTIEALMKPENEVLNIGSPLLVFFAAAAQGAYAAVGDMDKLLKGQPVTLMSHIPNITIDYKELLRIFLMLHHNESRMMSRMQALIELNTGDPLDKKITYIQGSAVISIRLWFIPELMKSLQVFGVSSCKIKANRCEIAKTAVMSY
jgi:hypothetical protein